MHLNSEACLALMYPGHSMLSRHYIIKHQEDGIRKLVP